MPRRRVVEDPVSHDRWLVSYADFITLLFAFFVVMYSISQVNDGKYKVLADTLTEAFGTPEYRIDPFQIGEVARSNPRNFVELSASALIERERHGEQGNDQLLEGGIDGSEEVFPEPGLAAEFEQINDRIEEAFGDLLEQKLITVRGNEDWLEVELKSSLLFESGDARLTTTALELLGSISTILKDQPNPVRVEGFTDNIPINTPLYPSNWELSTARASAVVQLFTEEGMDPGRLAAIGYGEFQPIVENTTEQGRSRNRRVVLMISKTGELRPMLREVASADELAEQVKAAVTGIQIIIPGVNEPEVPEPVAPVVAPAEPVDNEGTLNGIRTIELEGGGLLFTNEEPAEAPTE